VALSVVICQPAEAGLEQLAIAGQWQRLLDVASIRSDQLPLRADEAYLAAYAARSVGDRRAEKRFLVQASETGPFSQLAQLELARLEVADDAGRAVRLILPIVRRAPTREMREAAVDIAARAVELELDSDTRLGLEQTVYTLPRSVRRPLELALAHTDTTDARQRLGRMLSSSTRDLEAMRAARILLDQPHTTEQESWWIAQTLYRHAHYDEAIPLLESIDGVHHRSIPRWQVAYLRGRCAFRRGRWTEASDWYGRAIARTRGGERTADLEVHRARAFELDDDMEAAVEAAQRAVRLRTTDDRRLYLARLRLRRGELDLAIHGINRIRGRTARSRGELMLALFHLRRGEVGEAARRLDGIRRTPWNGPAAVLAAELEISGSKHSEALTRLEAVAIGLDGFWADRARELMLRMPDHLVGDWRSRMAALVSSQESRARRRSLAIWATLEPDPERLARLEPEVVREVGLEGLDGLPAFEPGLAGDLWRLGLGDQAVRWDPRGMPLGDARSSLWSARRFLELGSTRRAIVTADAAWRMSGSEIPTRAYPNELQEALYPLPTPRLVWRAAVDMRVPWSLLAALAREESRWEAMAVSRVGARGVMQLMPGTAADVARRLERPPPTAEELFDPALSLELGAAEMRRLVEAFGGRWAPAIAAYNAGEAQARLWLDQCGEGCSQARFVATITFSATRTYTRNVLSTANIYSELYGATLETPAAAAGAR
jgi:tetratricopeptide (TPR) repeat protein